MTKAIVLLLIMPRARALREVGVGASTWFEFHHSVILEPMSIEWPGGGHHSSTEYGKRSADQG